MNPYGTTNKCPKCGQWRWMNGENGIQEIELKGGKHIYGDRFKLEFLIEDERQAADLPDHKPEAMRITCSRCGFQFLEKPLDGGKGEVALDT